MDEEGLPEDKFRVLADFSQDPVEQASDAPIEQCAAIFSAGPEATADVIGQHWRSGQHPPGEVFDRAGESFSR